MLCCAERTPACQFDPQRSQCVLAPKAQRVLGMLRPTAAPPGPPPGPPLGPCPGGSLQKCMDACPSAPLPV
jgi:hypothetical protein